MQPTTLNKRLAEFMPGLSAKVFRTYNASVTLQKELPDCDEDKTTQMKVRPAHTHTRPHTPPHCHTHTATHTVTHTATHTAIHTATHTHTCSQPHALL